MTLTWSQPSGGSPIQTYDIYRNDMLVDQVDVGTTTYTDQSVATSSGPVSPDAGSSPR